MSSKTYINNKISEIQKYLISAESYKAHTREKIENDDTIRLSLERILFLLTQATIDLGEMIIGYKKLRKATTLKEIFAVVHEHNLIPLELRNKLMDMTGFRNILVHDYAKINYDRVYEVLHKDLKDVEEFIALAGSIK